MSNFLSQFSNDQYKPPGKAENVNAEKKTNTRDLPEQSVPGDTLAADQSYEPYEEPADESRMDAEDYEEGYYGMDEYPEDEGPDMRESIRRGEGGARIISPEHVVERDDSYHKRKIIRYIVIASTVVVVCVIAFFIFRMINQVTVKNFVGTSLEDAKTWGLTNNITLEVETVYNKEYDDGIIIEQSKDPEAKLQKGSVLSFRVSQGPDPDERIELPDFSSMTTNQVYAWKEEEKALNANIVEEYSEKVEENQFIRMEFTSKAVTEENYLRKDGLLIYMSLGPEEFEKDITVPDFKEKSKEEADTWVNTNELKVTYKEETSNKVPAGFVISQNVKPDTKVAKNSKITFVISLGKAITVPDFNTMTQEEAAAYPGLSVTIKTKYSASVEYGRVISQSEPAGTELIGDELNITVTYSEGRPFIENLTGKTEKELEAYFYEFRIKGASITYSVSYVDSSVDKGLVVWSSRSMEYIGMEAHINIHISKGNLAKPQEDENLSAGGSADGGDE